MLSNENCYVIDCSIDWKSKQKKIINNGNGKCIESCSDDTQYQNEYNYKCYQDCPQRTYNINYLCYFIF